MPMPLPMPITRAQAIEQGWSPWQLRTGTFVHVARDTYLPPGDDHDLITRARGVLLTMPPGSLISHDSAARIWGIDLPRAAESELIQVIAPRALRPKHRADRVVHEAVRLGPADADTVEGVAVTSPARTWWDLATSLAPADLLAVTDQLLRSWSPRLLLERMLSEHTGDRGAVRARGALRYGDSRAESRMESVLRWVLIEGGLPAPELQHVVVDTTGFIARVDLAYPLHMIAIEYDGAVHRNSDVFIQDLRRQNRLVAAGWTVLRFSGSDVLARPADVVSQVLQARLAAVRTRAAS
ncbi:MAG: DUF559 domain-containing protein [Geodermatophilaceae bacterium]|nr:DUF559 domain-containing protein [Geodermatophilaceae bacterium]